MGKGAETTTQQQSVSNPWEPAQPYLMNALGKLGNLNTDVTGAQSTALQNLQNAAGAVPNMGGAATTAVNNLFNSSTAPQAGMLRDSLAGLRSNIGSTANGSELDPMNTPGLSDAMRAMTENITNSVKGTYAASGRDPSGAGSFAGSLGKGLTQGLAPMLTSQYNQNKQNQMSAANTLFGAGGTTATGLTNLDQTQLQNGVSGLNGAGMLSGLYTQPATTALTAANAGNNQQFANLQAMLGPLMGIAGLGGQTSGTGRSEQTPSTMSNIMGGVSGGLGILGTLFSDERVKDDIEEVGALKDGQPVYRYRYKGDPVHHIGLLAQDVIKHTPRAVHNVGGILAVNYKDATDAAAAA